MDQSFKIGDRDVSREEFAEYAINSLKELGEYVQSLELYENLDEEHSKKILEFDGYMKNSIHFEFIEPWLDYFFNDSEWTVAGEKRVQLFRIKDIPVIRSLWLSQRNRSDLKERVYRVAESDLDRIFDDKTYNPKRRV